MKKYGLLIPLCAMGLALASCSDSNQGLMTIFDNYADGEGHIDTPWEDFGLPLKSINFANGEDNLKLEKGETHTYEYTTNPIESLVSWRSSDESVATVSKGVVTAKDSGTAVITAYGGTVEKPVTKDLYVTVVVSATDFTVNSSKELTLDISETSMIETTVLPEETTEPDLVYVSNDESVATVNGSGLITAIGVGETTISVTHPSLNKIEVVNVTVIDGAKYLTNLQLTADDYTVELGQTTELHTVLTPEDATYQTVEYEVIAGNDYISISNGVVSANAVGKASIVAKVYEIRKGEFFSSNIIDIDVYEVIPTSIEINEGDLALDNVNNPTAQLTYSYFDGADLVTPTRGGQDVTWSSSNTSVATVSPSGFVNIKARGNAVITVRDNIYEIEDTINVSVSIYSTSVLLSATSEKAFVGEEVTLTASTVPSISELSDQGVQFTVSPSANATLVVDGVNATLSASVAGTYTVTVTNGSRSASKDIKFVNAKKIYLNTNSMFDSDGVVPFVHAWGGGLEALDAKMTLVKEGETIYTVSLSEEYEQMVFLRMPMGSTAINWDTYYNKTKDLTIPTDGKDMWTMSGYAPDTEDKDDHDKNFVLGSWGTYDPSQPYPVDHGEPFTIYLNANNMFDTDNCVPFVHAWGDNISGSFKMTKVSGSDVMYSAEITTKYTHVIFVRMPAGSTALDWDTYYNKTPNQEIPSGKNMWTMSGYGDADENAKTYLTGSWGVYDGSDPTPGPGPGPGPEPGEVTIYLNANNMFDSDGVLPFVHAWGDGVTDLDVKMTLVKENETVYSVTLSENHTSIIFLRMPAGSTAVSWDDYYNKSDTLSVPTDGKNMWTMSGYAPDSDPKDDHEKTFVLGSWGTYDPSASYPVDGGGSGGDDPTPQPGLVTYTINNLPNWIKNDGCKVFVWAWGGDAGTPGTWYSATLNDTTLTFQAPANITGLLLARCHKDTTEPNWSAQGDVAGRVYNQSGDLNITSGTTTYNSPSWN